MDYTVLITVMLFVILISIQYTLNKILVELRRIRQQKERESEKWHE